MSGEKTISRRVGETVSINMDKLSRYWPVIASMGIGVAMILGLFMKDQLNDYVRKSDFDRYVYEAKAEYADAALMNSKIDTLKGQVSDLKVMVADNGRLLTQILLQSTGGAQ